MIGIYKITNTINNLCYIGQSIDIHARWKAHKYQSQKITNEERSLLYLAIKKYGIEHFVFEVLEECEIAELNQKEIYYIKKYDSYKNGYNQTLGGDLPPYSGKSTCQWDLNGNLIKKWPSGAAAARALGVTRSSIYEVITGRRKTCCGSLWTREEDNITPVFQEYKGGVAISIIQYDLEGKKLAEYDSIDSAAKALGYERGGNIASVISGKSNTAYGYQWRKSSDEPPQPIKIKQPRHPLYQYDLEGKFIKEWRSAQEAALYLGYNKAYFYSKKWVNGEVISNGYKWKRTKE